MRLADLYASCGPFRQRHRLLQHLQIRSVRVDVWKRKWDEHLILCIVLSPTRTLGRSVDPQEVSFRSTSGICGVGLGASCTASKVILVVIEEGDSEKVDKMDRKIGGGG